MNTRDRYFHIDVLRAIGILLMILTHVLSWHLGTPHILELWNAIHFVVVGLVFCSAYLYAKNTTKIQIHHRLYWFVKRVLRLYIPFIVYVFVHYLLWYIFPDWLRGYGLNRSMSYIVSTLTLSGGVDIGWLPTVCIQLSILFPFLLPLTRHVKTRNVLVVGLLVFCLITTFVRIPTAYTRYIAWLPWSIVAIFGFIYSDAENMNQRLAKKLTTIVIWTSVTIYAGLYISLRVLHHSIMFTDHKYPPDLFYLSYGLVCTSLLLSWCGYYEVFALKLRKYITFISRESYMIFFVHMIILDVVMTKIASNWIYESLLIGVVSLAVTYTLAHSAMRVKLLRQTHNITQR